MELKDELAMIDKDILDLSCEPTITKIRNNSSIICKHIENSQYFKMLDSTLCNKEMHMFLYSVLCCIYKDTEFVTCCIAGKETYKIIISNKFLIDIEITFMSNNVEQSSLIHTFVLLPGVCKRCEWGAKNGKV